MGAQDGAPACLHCAGLEVSQVAQAQCWEVPGCGPEGLACAGGGGGGFGSCSKGRTPSLTAFLPPSSPIQMAATIDMNFQSDLLSIFEENLF